MKHKQPNFTVLADDSQTALRVCLCNCNHNDCGNSIPLKNLMEYLGNYGGEGKLKIEILYKDKKGNLKKLFNKDQYPTIT